MSKQILHYPFFIRSSQSDKLGALTLFIPPWPSCKKTDPINLERRDPSVPTMSNSLHVRASQFCSRPDQWWKKIRPMQWNGRWFLLVYYCHWINGEGLTLMGGFISTILQCIVISHWFLQSLFPYIGWQGTIDCCCSHPCPFCIFFLQNFLNQLLVGSGH